ncbi:MAG: hypothetical protein AB1457_07590 [Chloroflexota bacterium]
MAKDKEPKPEKEKSPKKPQTKRKNPQPDVSLPLFAEVFFSFSTMMLLLVTLVIVLVSFMSGATLMEVFLRAVVGVVSLGTLLWFLTYQVSSGLANARATEQTARQEKAFKPGSSPVGSGGEAQNQPGAGEVKE